MAKKTLLEGRKRISDLADGAAVAAKKQELLDLKSQEMPESEKSTPVIAPEQTQLSLDQAEPIIPSIPVAPHESVPQPAPPDNTPERKAAPLVKTPEIASTVAKPAPELATPVIKPIMPDKPSVSVAPRPTPVPPQRPAPVNKVTANPVQEGVAAAAHLQQLYAQLELAGNRHRYQYSGQARHDALVQEIKKIISQKARQYQLQGLNEQTNLVYCQTFVDTVRHELLKSNIKVNHLKVKKPKR